jgi:hypothetical protein
LQLIAAVTVLNDQNSFTAIGGIKDIAHYSFQTGQLRRSVDRSLPKLFNSANSCQCCWRVARAQEIQVSVSS